MLLEKDEKFHCDEPQKEPFKDLTKALCNEPILKYPALSQQFYLSMDGSATAILSHCIMVKNTRLRMQVDN